jgi:PAS domain S-box-containing protein
MKFNLRTRVNAAILITFSLIALICGLAPIPFERKHFQADAGKIKVLLRTLVERNHREMAAEISEGRREAARVRLKEIMAVEGMAAAAVWNEKGNLLAAEGGEAEKAVLRFSETGGMGHGFSMSLEKWKGQDVICCFQELEFRGRPAGFMQLYYSLENIRWEHRRLRLFLTAFLLSVLVVMLFVINRLLSKTIIGPITYLRDAMLMMRVDDGPGRQVYVKNTDEIGELAEDFNRLSAALAKSYKKAENQEKQLRRTQNYLDNLINSMPSILVGIGPDGRITHWNTEAARFTGLDTEAARGEMFPEIFPMLADEMKKINKAIQTGQIQRDERVVLKTDGKNRYADITVYPLKDPDGLKSEGLEGAVIRVDDVTEYVRLQEMMIQSEKMLSVGGLAAGMAHEINNPLGGILQNIQVIGNRLLRDLPKNTREARECGTTFEAVRAYAERRGIPEMIASAMDSGQRAVHIVDNMLSFSRKSRSNLMRHHLGDLLDKTVELAENDYELNTRYGFRNIEIIREYDPALPEVLCEATKLQQVFFNILKNGAQAMAGGQAPPQFILRVMPDDGMVRVEIEDSGPGMTEEIRLKAFEPFFTTKPVGQGTGLGLSVSYFIITQNHGGTLSVASEPEKGSRFIICLPVKPRTQDTSDRGKAGECPPM